VVPTPTGPGSIRHALPREFGLLRQIEAASDEMFADVGIGPFSESDDEDHLARAALVLVAGDPPVGFASVEVVDDAAHIWQLSVLPAEGRRGRGTALVKAVCAWGRGQGFEAVTLTTYRDVPWNGPFYARMGFVVVEEQDLSPGLVAIRAHERGVGDDDFGPRVAMRKALRPR